MRPSASIHLGYLMSKVREFVHDIDVPGSVRVPPEDIHVSFLLNYRDEHELLMLAGNKANTFHENEYSKARLSGAL